MYLAVFVDLFSRRVVGWAAAEHMRTELVVDALEMAVRRRQPTAGLIVHSDRGSQYASGLFRRRLAGGGFVASMSRKGDCWDNAVAESFFGSLKSDLVDRYSWPTRDGVIDALAEHIEVFYDAQRLHSSLGYRTPAEVKRYHHHNAAQAA